MNKYQSSRLDSLKLIVRESKNNPQSIALVPKFNTLIDRLDQICIEADNYRILQEKDLTGITTDKGFALENVIDWSLEIAGAVYSYAHDINDNALMARVDFKQTNLEQMSQSEIIVTAGIILEEASKLAPEVLNNEGISAEELNSFATLVSSFKEIRSSNREAVIDRSRITEKLSKLFVEAGTILNGKLDRLAVQFKRKDPDFYLKYKAARTMQYRNASKKGKETDTNKPA